MTETATGGGASPVANPVESEASLIVPDADHSEHPQKEILPGDSSTTRAEKVERTGGHNTGSRLDDRGADGGADEDNEGVSKKRIKLDHNVATSGTSNGERVKGIAAIKAEYLIDASKSVLVDRFDEDAAEASGKANGHADGGKSRGKKSKGGQNTSRKFGSSRDAIQLCKSRDHADEGDAITCKFGEKCRLEHDIRKYLEQGKREDLSTFGRKCPVKEASGTCPVGWRCRFAGSHSREDVLEDGTKRLVSESMNGAMQTDEDDAAGTAGIVNQTSNELKIKLQKRQVPMPKSDQYLKWLNENYDAHKDAEEAGGIQDHRATYTEPPLRPSEKRRIYYGPETPILAPLTTQGNLPFRRLCVELGAQVTWSEMAMGIPLLQGEKSEWALIRAHESEISPPKYTPTAIVTDYDNAKDLKFGAQIAGNKPWVAVKTTEILTKMAPHLRAIDLNCGCPIELVYRQGAGSALMDAPGKLEKILRGMSLVSGEVPITVKIRMGTKDKFPTAEKLCQRLIMGGHESQTPAGVAAIALHGRSRQQRYTRSADWEYIAQCASLVNNLRNEQAIAQDTIREADARDQGASGNGGLPYFIGNGDVLSHTEYTEHFDHANIDGVMIGRGALLKPWIFEEIQAGQYLDKSSSERLSYVEKFCRNGLEYWGSDEIGVGNTRRYLLEWLSFTYRYVPVGLLEHLPPRLGDRPPAFRGRDDLETLMASANYKDWIKIR